MADKDVRIGVEASSVFIEKAIPYGAVRFFMFNITDDATALTTGDGKMTFVVPVFINGYNLVFAHAYCTTASSSGTPEFQIANVTDSQDMLSTKITIDANEYSSHTAATAPAINASYDDVATGDRLRIDCDTAGTGAKGITLILGFEKP